MPWISPSSPDVDMQHPPVVSIEGLQVERRKGGTQFCLEVVSFEAFLGEFIAVSGPSGCGKSTFLDILGLGLEPSGTATFTLRFPGEGAIQIPGAYRNDTLISGLRRQHIGYVLQTGGLLPFLSVRDNIGLPLALQGRDDAPAVTALAQDLGIADQLEKKPSQLSGGQRQRVAIARAAIHRPSLILADEPTAAVDRPNAIEIMRLFRELARKRNTLVILVTHDEELAATVADRRVHFSLHRHNHESRATIVPSPQGDADAAHATR